MSIQSEITRIKSGVTAAKTAVTSKGGTVSTTSIDDLASEIATIPQEGPIPVGENLYGRVIYYESKKFVVDGELQCQGCTAEVVDEDKLSDFMLQCSDPNSLMMVYENGQWAVNFWEIMVDDPLEEMGMAITIDESSGSANISASMKPSYSNLKEYNFKSLSELDGLCNLDLTKTINGQSIDNDAIYDFLWGSTTPTSIGDAFMCYCKWPSASVPSTVLTIGNYFCQDAAFKVLTIDNVNLSVGNQFLRGARFRNFTNSNPITFGESAFMGAICSGVNIKLANDNIPNSFCYELRANSLTLSSTATSCGHDCFFGARASNMSVNDLANLTSVGNSFARSVLDTNSANTLIASLMSGNKPLTIGNNFGADSNCTEAKVRQSLTSVGTGFLHMTKYMSVFEAASSVCPSDGNSLSNSDSTCPAYVRGVLLIGEYASTWKDNLPDKAKQTYPQAYRKLVLS